eukprot:3378623-Pleurochrysis_carterae.AAC.1
MRERANVEEELKLLRKRARHGLKVTQVGQAGEAHGYGLGAAGDAQGQARREARQARGEGLRASAHRRAAACRALL